MTDSSCNYFGELDVFLECKSKMAAINAQGTFCSMENVISYKLEVMRILERKTDITRRCTETSAAPLLYDYRTLEELASQLHNYI